MALNAVGTTASFFCITSLNGMGNSAPMPSASRVAFRPSRLLRPLWSTSLDARNWNSFVMSAKDVAATMAQGVGAVVSIQWLKAA